MACHLAPRRILFGRDAFGFELFGRKSFGFLACCFGCALGGVTLRFATCLLFLGSNPLGFEFFRSDAFCFDAGCFGCALGGVTLRLEAGLLFLGRNAFCFESFGFDACGFLSGTLLGFGSCGFFGSDPPCLDASCCFCGSLLDGDPLGLDAGTFGCLRGGCFRG